MQTVTVKLPSNIYRQVQKRAQTNQRTVEDEVVDALEMALESQDSWAGIPAEIADEVEQLQFLDDAHLWRVARTIVPTEKAERMQELAWKQQAEGLNAAEQAETAVLRQLANRVMLLRAEAAVLLQQRGHDISPLNQSAIAP
ncbi:MAG: hypothetical protein KJ069_10105 [Anaerolineae bacterium]|nr:hypothetical protein [Anaerolineae bacterium]